MKKIISAIIIIALTFNVYVFGYNDVSDGTQYKSSIDFLTSLGIMSGKSDEEFEPLSMLTRAEFVTVIFNILKNHRYVYEEIETQYIDVTPDHWAANAIKIVSDLGFIKGNEENKFLPDESITYEQAVKIMICLLGYETYAEMQGGYPSGYMMIAREKQLLNNLSLGYQNFLNRAQAAQLIYNACSIEVLFKQDISNNSYQFYTKEEKTMLAYYFNIVKKSNVVVTGNSTSMISRESTLRDGEIMLDTTIYKTGETDIDKYLGYTLNVYYTTEDKSSDMFVVYFESPSNKNATIIIKKDEFINYQDKKLKYQLENETAINSINIPPFVDIIYNGKAVEYDNSLFEIQSGNITLLDSENDGEYELIFIKEHQNITIGSIDYRDYIFYDKYNSNQIIDLYATDKNKYKIYDLSTGEEILFDDLSTDDFVNVFNSKDNQYHEVYLCTQSIQGTIEEIGTDIITISSVSYKFSKSLFETKDVIKIGDAGSFYFDIDGKIAKCTIEDTEAIRYGYFMDMGEYGLGARKIQLLDQTGEVKIYNIAQKIVLDGSLVNTSKNNNGEGPLDIALKYDYSTGLNSENYIKQVIKYSINKNQEIREVDTLNISADENESSLNQDISAVKKLRKYKLYTKSFMLEINASNTTVIFRVPNADNSDSSYLNDSENYDVVDTSYFAHDRDYTIEGFDYEDGHIAKAIVVYTSGVETVINSASLCLVDKITTSLNSEGDTTLKMYCLSNGKHVEYLAKSPSVFYPAELNGRMIKQGDVVRISVDKNNVINNVTVDVNIDEVDGSTLGYRGTFMTDFYEFLGKVKEKGNGYFVLETQRSYDGKIETIDVAPIATGNVYIFDIPRKEIYNGSFEDMISGENGNASSYVFVRMSYESCKEVIIFKF